jgi:methyl-accepting chemotaxis protein
MTCPSCTFRRFLLVTLAVNLWAAMPARSLADAVVPRPAAEAPADSLSPQDRDALAAAEQLAGEASQAIEQWLSTQAITEDRLFARVYFPVAKTNPKKFSTPYDALAERDLVAVEDRVLSRSPAFQYAIVTDINAYVPAHNTRFAQPLTGNVAEDYIHNRTKRLLGDDASVLAAHSEARYLLQRSKLDRGEVIFDISVPVVVRGKRWGCARIGYRRSE